MRVLLLGGTADGRELADVLRAGGHEVIESAAGRTAQSQASGRAGRVGGFGGVSGLIGYLAEAEVDAVVDATHPFAARMSQNAAEACVVSGTRLLRLVRPGWRTHPYAGDWMWVPDHTSAAGEAWVFVAGDHPGRILLTVGRQPLPAYRELPVVTARVAEWQDQPIPSGWRIVEQRGPFTLPDELELIRREVIVLLISKDSGGDYTAAKLEAAHQLGVPVIMVQRPVAPEGVEQVDSAAGVIAWLKQWDRSGRD